MLEPSFFMQRDSLKTKPYKIPTSHGHLLLYAKRKSCRHSLWR